MSLNTFLKKVKRKLFQKQVFVFGDSHTEIFEHIGKKFPFFKYRFRVVKVGGATAQGMRNPNSKTNALGIFLDEIMKIQSKSTKIFLLLGEVDTGFVIWYRSQKYNEDVQIQLENSITAYINFIKKLQELGFKNITVFSAPLPTIEDGQTWGEIANARKEITATKRQRTDLTLNYNHLLKTECNKQKIKFISTDAALLDEKTHLIKDYYKNSDPNNHHLDIDKYSNLIKSYF